MDVHINRLDQHPQPILSKAWGRGRWPRMIWAHRASRSTRHWQASWHSCCEVSLCWGPSHGPCM